MRPTSSVGSLRWRIKAHRLVLLVRGQGVGRDDQFDIDAMSDE